MTSFRIVPAIQPAAPVKFEERAVQAMRQNNLVFVALCAETAFGEVTSRDVVYQAPVQGAEEADRMVKRFQTILPRHRGPFHYQILVDSFPVTSFIGDETSPLCA